MNNSESKGLPKQKFVVGQNVETDLFGKMQIIDSWYGEKGGIVYVSSKDGSWVYRLAYTNKDGSVNKRKHHRSFEESRLKQI